MQSSDAFAKAIGYPISPLDDLLTFHMVFGKTTPEISLNAIANLGYASCRFLKPVYPGDTLASTSEVIGLKENSNRETGTVYVRSTGRNQNGDVVLEYVPLGDGAQTRQGGFEALRGDRAQPAAARRPQGPRRLRCRR